MNRSKKSFAAEPLVEWVASAPARWEFDALCARMTALEKQVKPKGLRKHKARPRKR